MHQHAESLADMENEENDLFPRWFIPLRIHDFICDAARNSLVSYLHLRTTEIWTLHPVFL